MLINKSIKIIKLLVVGVTALPQRDLVGATNTPMSTFHMLCGVFANSFNDIRVQYGAP